MMTNIKMLFPILACMTLFTNGYCDTVSGNQTDALSPIYPPDSLPFTLELQTASFEIPGGLHSYAYGVYKGKVLCIAGRTNGLHGFDDSDDNFPPSQQNTNILVIDLATKKTAVKSLADSSSGLSQQQIDYLSVTAPEYAQSGTTLYVVGGYGVDTATGDFSTKPILSAINIPGLIKWVEGSDSKKTAAQYIRQISDPLFQVTGGALYQTDPHSPFLLIFGQNFDGFYTDGSNGVYTEQIRTFRLVDDGKKLAVFDKSYKPTDPNYRRRDLNVVSIVQKQERTYAQSYVAFSGVFTTQTGIWTVPVFISPDGDSFMPNPAKNSTFKQAMNNYNSVHVGLYSKKTEQMHTLVLGGISYETCEDGTCTFDGELPFTNNISDIVIKPSGKIKQYLMDTEYPVILSTGSNPGNQLLFGAGARFVPADILPSFAPGVFSLDKLKTKTLLGYIIGGIMSTVPNTGPPSDSAASPYIFKVFAVPR